MGYMRYRYRIRHSLLVPLYYPYPWILGVRSATQSARSRRRTRQKRTRT
jgi:hypothetical protein